MAEVFRGSDGAASANHNVATWRKISLSQAHCCAPSPIYHQLLPHSGKRFGEESTCATGLTLQRSGTKPELLLVRNRMRLALQARPAAPTLLPVELARPRWRGVGERSIPMSL